MMELNVDPTLVYLVIKYRRHSYHCNSSEIILTELKIAWSWRSFLEEMVSDLELTAQATYSGLYGEKNKIKSRKGKFLFPCDLRMMLISGEKKSK